MLLSLLLQAALVTPVGIPAELGAVDRSLLYERAKRFFLMHLDHAATTNGIVCCEAAIPYKK
jgi:hypothetical protein